MAIYKDPEKKTIEDILDITETESSSSDEGPDESPVFESSPYIMDVHEISKDSPAKPAADPALSATTDSQRQSLTLSNKQKMKKIKKKKKKSPSQATMSSESASETSVSPAVVAAVKEEPAKEEFYDAHESYHTIGGLTGVSENTALPTTAVPVTTNPQAPGVVTKPMEQPTNHPVVPASPPIAIDMAHTHSEHAADPKIESSKTTQGQAEGRKGPSIINKPANNPPE